MMFGVGRIVFALVFGFAGLGAVAQEKGGELVKASLVADADAVVPGRTFTLGVRFTIAPHWHIYWKNPGESGDATRVKLSGPAGVTFGEVQFPVPKKIELDGGVTYGYEDEVMLLVPVTVSKELSAGGEATIRAELTWQSCKETCVDGEAKVAVTLPVRGEAKGTNGELFEAWRGRLPVSREQGGEAIAKVEQEKGADGAPVPAVTVEWKRPQAGKVDWYPVSTRAVAIENVVVVHEGARTRVRFKPTVYKPEDVPGGRVEGLLVYEDGAGRRRGVEVSVGVPVRVGR